MFTWKQNFSMIPRAHSIEDVRISDRNRSNIPGFVDLMNECIDLYKDDKVELAKERRRELLHKFFDKYDYSCVGESNSIWGIQKRLSGYKHNNLNLKSDIESASKDLGFIVQDQNHPDLKASDTRIFVPHFERYISYDHSMNIPNVDLIIADNNNTVELKSDKKVLDTFSNVFSFDDNRKELSVLKNYDNSIVDDIIEFARDNGYSYALAKSISTAHITEEWSPNANKFVVAWKETRSRYKAHIIKSFESSKSMCGTDFNKRDVTILPKERFEDTYDNHQYWSVDWCGHPACSSDI